MEAILRRVEALLKTPLLSHRRVQGGYTPALRLVCTTKTQSVFVKAGITPLTAEFLRQEISNYTALRGPFLPECLGADSEAEVPLLVLEDLSHHTWPPPWDERRVALVLEQLQAMHATTCSLEQAAPLESHWAKVAADPEPFLSLGFVEGPWLEKALPTLLAAEASISLEGEALCHLDLRSDNLCLTPTKALFVDWNWAARANPILDLGFWLPSLSYEGGPLPETILPDSPAVAAVVSGYFAAQAGLPGIPDAPFVRRVQREQLTTALPWATRALELPPPDGILARL